MDGMEGGEEKKFLILSFEKTNSCEIRLASACIFKIQTVISFYTRDIFLYKRHLSVLMGIIQHFRDLLSV